MRITRLAGENWMGFEEFDLDLGSVDQVVIFGKNMIGKTALQNALTWCLFEQVERIDVNPRSGDQFIRFHTDLMAVEVEFDTAKGEHVAVRREKPRGSTQTLDLVVNGATQKGAIIAETQARIIELIGLPYAAFAAGPLMVQLESGAFMRADPSVRKDLLIRLLGVDQYATLHKKAKAKREDAERDVAAATARLFDARRAGVERIEVDERLETSRGNLASAMEAQALATDRITTARVKVAEARAMTAGYAETVERLARLTPQRRMFKDRIVANTAKAEQAEAALAQAAPTAPELPPTVDVTALAVAGRRLAEAEDARERYIGAEAQLGRLRDRLGAAEGRRAILPTVPCHGEGEFAACQFLREVPKEEDLAVGRTKLTELEASLVDLKTWADSVPGLRAEVDQLREGHRAWERAAERAASEQRVWQTRREAAEELVASLRTRIEEDAAALVGVDEDWTRAEAKRTNLEGAQGLLASHERELSEGLAALAAAQNAVRYHEPVVRELERQSAVLAATEATAVEAEAALAATGEQVKTFALLEAAWHRDGVPTAVIEHAVPLIEARANEVLARLPQDLRLSMRTQRPLKGKGMAETLDVIINVGGNEVAYGMLSPGGQLRVDMGLRLALAQVLTHRSGRTIDTLWLDEPLASLDDEGKDSFVEMLSALAPEFGLVVVVSHDPQFNDRFGARIEVREEDGVAVAMLA